MIVYFFTLGCILSYIDIGSILARFMPKLRLNSGAPPLRLLNSQMAQCGNYRFFLEKIVGLGEAMKGK